MHNREFVLENETHKTLWDFEIQTDHLISTRQPDEVMIKKKKKKKREKTCRIVDFAVPADYRIKLKEIRKRDMYQDQGRKLKKTMEHESDGDTNYKWCAQYNHQRLDTSTGGLGHKGTSGDHLSKSIVEIGRNTKKILGDCRRLSLRLQ